MSLTSNVSMLTTEERLTKNIILLQRAQKFFAYILMHFALRETQENSKVPTMAVNAFGDLYWNSDFVDSLSNAGLQYVLCHEVLHIAAGDLVRVGNRDSSIWNVAADCVKNNILNQEGFTPPVYTSGNIPKDMKDIRKIKPGDNMGLIPDKKQNIQLGDKVYHIGDKCTEEVYDDLIEDMEQIKIYLCISGDGKDGESGHGGFDIHLEGDKDDKKESQDKGGEKSSGLSQQENHWRKLTVEAAVFAKERGELPGFAEHMIDDILNPKLDWRSRVRSFITNTIPFDFENRMPGRSFYSTGVWCPRTLKEDITLLISLDCSGSTMGDRERFMGECCGILNAHRNVKARLICWDTIVNPANDIEVGTNTIERLKKLNLKNVNGGTNISAYAKYVEEKGYSSRYHIHLTDGYIEKNPILPPGTHLFVLCGSFSDEILKEYGECIEIHEEY